MANLGSCCLGCLHSSVPKLWIPPGRYTPRSQEQQFFWYCGAKILLVSGPETNIYLYVSKCLALFFLALISTPNIKNVDDMIFVFSICISFYMLSVTTSITQCLNAWSKTGGVPLEQLNSHTSAIELDYL